MVESPTSQVLQVTKAIYRKHSNTGKKSICAVLPISKALDFSSATRGKPTCTKIEHLL